VYIHLGGEKIIRTSQIIAILDVSIEQSSDFSRQFVEEAQKNRKVEMIGEEAPKSIVVTEERVYYSPISTATLMKRTRSLEG
jgi:hypothetical protein